jgi:hypothetical protein
MIGLQTAHPPVGPSSAMSYFSGKSGPNQEDYNQVRHLQGHPVMLSSNSHQYRETGNGYRSPDSISPYRSPAMADDYSPSPSRQFMEAHVSPPPGGSSQHHSSHQVAPGRTNSIVARMEGIEVSSNRRDVDDPPEGSAPHDRSGIVDGRGNGDVVMQRSNEANTRRTFSDGRIGILPPGTFSARQHEERCETNRTTHIRCTTDIYLCQACWRRLFWNSMALRLGIASGARNKAVCHAMWCWSSF